MENVYLTTAEQSLYNTRTKLYPNGEVAQIMVCNQAVFNPDKLERVKKGGAYKSEDSVTDTHTNSGRAAARAKAAVFDLAMCNPDCNLFITLTLDGAKIDRYDYKAIIKKLNTYFDNRVRRNGLKYICVAEQHKDGAVHFHALCNNALPLVDSGTVLVEGAKKPVKISTWQRRYKDQTPRTVYNISDWTLGYSTAVFAVGEWGKVARYISKYITKDSNKAGGRYYLHGGNLATPRYLYSNTDYDSAEGYVLSVSKNVAYKFFR